MSTGTVLKDLKKKNCLLKKIFIALQKTEKLVMIVRFFDV